MTVSKRFFARLKRGADDVSCDKFAFFDIFSFSQREGGGEEEGGSGPGQEGGSSSRTRVFG